jgi:two-component system sensor histidine kinase MprB
MSLRWRWALSVAAVTVIAVAATTVAGLVTTEAELRDQVDRELLARFAVASEAVPVVPPRGPFDRTDRDPFEVRPGEGFDARDLVGLDAVIQVTIGGDTVVPGEPRLPARTYGELAEGPVLETIEADGATYRMISGQVHGPRLVRAQRVVQLAIPVDDIDEAVALLVRRLAALGVALAALAGAIGWAMARRAVRPIEQLTRVTDSMAESVDGDHDLPADAPGEVGHLARSFRAMVNSLRTSRAQQRMLIADAGHEFRTPLTALRTNLETLSRQADRLTAEQRSLLLDAAISEAKELSELASELVDLATDSSSDSTPMEPCDLGDLVDAVIGRFRSRTRIPIERTGVGGMVVGRPSEVQRAISNLIDNAVKWSPVDGTVEVELTDRTVAVRDRGPGIPPADLPHVFERFHRAVEARSTAGSGLGLAIVEHIVTAHGGSVFARNRDGGGAEVGFSLP